MAFRRPGVPSIVSLILLAGTAAAALLLGGPPPAVPATAPPGEFSAERAMAHVAQIAQRPHPIGSADHARVRDYLVESLEGLGLAVQRQKTTAVRTRAGGATAASVENLLARIKGSASTGAVLLAGHYDSVPAAPGAADDGSGLAAALETLRALKPALPLRNDIIVLFTDGEELGLLGAEAFVAEHPWAGDVRVALNFEARGTTGPALMFETGERNGAVVREWASVVPAPSGSSLTYEVYRRLPNDTDFSVFRRAGAAGLNFAFIGNWRAYHTALDSIGALDPASLQHQGAAALALLRRFGAMDLAAIKERDAVYFTAPFLPVVVRYSTAWVLPLAGLTVFAFAWIVVSAWRRRNTSAGGLVLGLLLWLVLGGLAGLWGYYFSRMAGWIHARWLAPGNLLMSRPYAVALVMTTISAGLFVYALLRRWFAAHTLALSGMLVCLLGTSAASWAVPGASFALLWPLAGGLIAVTLLPPADARRSAPGVARTVALCALGLPSTVILWPLAAMLVGSLGLTPESGAAMALLTVLALFALAPSVDVLTERTRFWPAGVALIAAVAGLGSGMATTRYSAADPMTVNLTYALDADAHEAYWVARAPAGLPWLRPLMGEAPVAGRPDVLLPPGSSREGTPGYLHQRAEPVDLPAPEAVLVPGGVVSAGGRSLMIRVRPAAEGHVLSVWLSGASVIQAKVNGRDLHWRADLASLTERWWTLDYANAPASGITIELVLKGTDRAAIAVLDRRFGWPAVPGRQPAPRPADVVPSGFSDQTFVRRNYVF